MFDGSREFQFVNNIMKSIDDKNLDDFERVLYNYNKITPFDKLLTKVLTKVKERIPKEEMLEGGFQ